jgi:hypothetical protein
MTPITAVLCEGREFKFFRFMGGRQTRKGTLQIFLGKFPNGDTRQHLPVVNPNTEPISFFYSTRALCEALFYVFISGYQCRLESHWNRSVERSKIPLSDPLESVGLMPVLLHRQVQEVP